MHNSSTPNKPKSMDSLCLLALFLTKIPHEEKCCGQNSELSKYNLYNIHDYPFKHTMSLKFTNSLVSIYLCVWEIDQAGLNPPEMEKIIRDIMERQNGLLRITQ